MLKAINLITRLTCGTLRWVPMLVTGRKGIFKLRKEAHKLGLKLDGEVDNE